MAVYVIVEVEVTNEKEYEEYKALTPASIAAYDGKFVVRGGSYATLEGDWHPQRIVVLQFPSRDRAKEWWHSPEYALAKTIRQRMAQTKMIVIDGVE